MGAMTNFEASMTLAERIINSMYDAETGEITEEVQAQIEQLEAEIVANADILAAAIRVAEGKANVLQLEVDRLQAKVNRYKSTASWLKERIFNCMLSRNMPRIEAKYNTISIVNNGGVLPLVIPEGITLPKAYEKTVVTTSIDKEKVRKAVEAGDEQLANLGVKLGERGKRLSIK